MARCTACAVFGSRSLGPNLPVLVEALPCSFLTPRGGPGVCSKGLISASWAASLVPREAKLRSACNKWINCDNANDLAGHVAGSQH